MKQYKDTVGLVKTFMSDNTQGTVCSLLSYIYERPYDEVKEDLLE